MLLASPFETHGAAGPVAALVLRVVRGAAHRFPLRVSDWFAAWVLFSFGVVLFNWPGAFHSYVFYVLLEKIMGPVAWGAMCMMIGVGRLAALTINGTFPLFRWSPHLRFFMALGSCFIWTQITLGLLTAGVPTTAWAVYPQLLVFDLYNVFLAASEAGMVERQTRNGGE
jgi:hypothetical protein